MQTELQSNCIKSAFVLPRSQNWSEVILLDALGTNFMLHIHVIVTTGMNVVLVHALYLRLRMTWIATSSIDFHFHTIRCHYI